MAPRPASPPSEGPLIPQFFAGRSVFITGATGFMGKVLVERLLWTCPDVGRLFLLMREKKDVPPEKRLAHLKSSQVFDVIRQHCPHQLDKLQTIPGDTMKEDLGISIHSMSQLREVSVVFHSAATLKFDEALEVAVEQNVRSVMRLMDICDRLPNIDAFVHVSTAYCNAELAQVEERVYPPPAPLPLVLALARATPPHLLAQITQQYISPKPNTYTFTKALAENAIEAHPNRNYPVAIFRPTIVVSALRHPFPGWVENLNGPSGIVVGAGKGLLHVFCSAPGARADLLPVDVAIDTLLAVAWDTATMRYPETKVYNCSTFANPTTWGQFEVSVRRHLNVFPLDRAYWYPSGSSVQNKVAHKFLELLLQTFPLYVAEYVTRLFRVKTRLSLITVSQRLQMMNKVLQFFSTREWHFKTDNVRQLYEKLTPQDAAIYNLDVHSIDWDEHNLHFVKGIRKYLLQEKDQDLEEAKRHLRKMYVVHQGAVWAALALAGGAALRSAAVRRAARAALRLLLAAARRATRPCPRHDTRL